MAYFIPSCFILSCVVCLALGVLQAPCNNQYTDCGAGECCATITGAHDGYKGECQQYHSFGQPCTFGGPKEGECGCRQGSICVGFSDGDQMPVTATCQIILPGRK